ncbi:hypothetical protein [Streptomyces sp. LX-29]|nr:hypothetical protein [Streptomyces sp. LX-29]
MSRPRILVPLSAAGECRSADTALRRFHGRKTERPGGPVLDSGTW